MVSRTFITGHDEREPMPSPMHEELPQAGPRVVRGIEELIGYMPLIELSLSDAASGARLLAKLEPVNPLSSVRDRAALWMLQSVEDAGELKPGGTIIEATSDNTGISPAALAAARGYGCVMITPDSATSERIGLLEALSAEVMLTLRDLCYQGAIDRAEELDRATPGSCILPDTGERYLTVWNCGTPDGDLR